jgi:hypothetical protein
MGRSRERKIQPNENRNMKTGNGKIANLPAKIRDELNYRLNDGEQASELVEWLNAKPEVIQVITERFDGRPITEQNLSQWRTHGYRQWHAYRVILDESDTTSEHSGEIAATGIDCEKLLLSLTASYAEMIQRWIITPTDEMTYKLRVFKEITNAVLALRRAEIQKARLEIERQRLELLCEKQRNKSASSSASAASSSAESVSATSDERPKAKSPAAASTAPHSASSLPSSQAAPGAQPSGNPPPPPPPTPATSPKPVAPQDAPLWPSRRPGAPPRNASPRNPLGLL